MTQCLPPTAPANAPTLHINSVDVARSARTVIQIQTSMLVSVCFGAATTCCPPRALASSTPLHPMFKFVNARLFPKASSSLVAYSVYSLATEPIDQSCRASTEGECQQGPDNGHHTLKHKSLVFVERVMRLTGDPPPACTHSL
jgi:hypothetical protein